MDGSIAPVGANTAITSSPENGDTYGYEETIEFSITFSAALDVEGSRRLSLRVGSDDSDGWRGATYRSGSGALVFEYTVVENNSDSNGVNAFLPHGQDIKATGTDNAYQPDPGDVTPTMGEDSNHKVDGFLVTADITSPTISSVSFADSPGPGDDVTYGVGDCVGVWVTFNESVLTTGAPQRLS